MARKDRYYIKPVSGSYGVYDRGMREELREPACVVPMITLYQANQCRRSLNAGRGAWDWEHEPISELSSHYSVVTLRS